MINNFKRNKLTIILLAMCIVLALNVLLFADKAFAGTDKLDYWSVKIGTDYAVLMDSQGDAQAVISALKEHYYSSGSNVQNVTFDKALNVEYVNAEEYIKLEQTFQDGDFSQIGPLVCGSDINMAVSKILEGKRERIKYEEGEEVVFIPYYNVTVTENIREIKKISYEVKYEYASNKRVDESVTLVKGVNGSKEVIKEVTRLNGEVTDSKTLSTSIISEPTDKLVLKGTKHIIARKGKTYSFADGDDVAKFAKKYTGNPYKFGGSSLTKGSDCSGFVMAVYNNFGLDMAHGASWQRSYGRKVAYKYAKPGDIIIYPGHSAIYIGNGKIVHAMNRRKGICISNARYDTILSVRRVFED